MEIDFLYSFILGSIEGITEFLPISSTAHLIFISKIIGISQTDFHKLFEVFIQSGAIFAVIFNYFHLLKKNKNLIKKIIVSFIPTALLGFLMYKIIKNIFFENYLLISLSLVSIGIVFILIENLISKNKLKLELDLNDLSYKKAFLIGLFQSLAIVPGVSRAGAVILTMMLLRFKREEAVLYSFLLAVPTIILAGAYDLYKTGIENIFLIENFIHISIGFITSFIFAFLTIRWFIKYLQKNNLILFGVYRIIIGLVFVIYYYSVFF
ncbi:MAG: undecaprenyl-diphosphatase [Candidatus Parcubacteria bacterium]|nr:MAG: undecaprenyl-diphosphatase [Candidatus Parcubacteria bacterium]